MSALAEALIAAQAELPTALKRDATNADAQYRYMTLDALIAATRPILNKHGLALTQWPSMVKAEDGGLRPALTTRIQHEGGEVLFDTMPLYLRDKDMQGLGAAITYARRYAWASALGIAAEEDTDAAPMQTDADSIPF